MTIQSHSSTSSAVSPVPGAPVGAVDVGVEEDGEPRCAGGTSRTRTSPAWPSRHRTARRRARRVVRAPSVCCGWPSRSTRMDETRGVGRDPPGTLGRSWAGSARTVGRRGAPAPIRPSRGANMKFGVFYELSVPRPWTHESERQVYLNALEQVRLADELGFHSVWAVEHHFLEEYSHSSAPELFLTACAMQTKQIRVGHGIVVCVPQFNHPIRVAERAAVLDILSGGRLEFGTGRSATWTELGGFRADPDVTKKTWDEFVHAIPQMWMNERFGYEGEFFSMPTRAVLPEAVPAAAPADVGRGVVAGHRVRRRRPRHGRARRELHDVQGPGGAGPGVPPPHPALRAGRRVRQRQARLGELPVLPRGLGDRRRDRQEHDRHVPVPRRPARHGQGGVADEGLPVARACSPRRAARRPARAPPASRRRGSPSATPSRSSAS